MDQFTTIAVALGLAWASGIRLYAVLFLVGLTGHFQWLDWTLPPSLHLLSHPIVLVTTGTLLIVEFFADKIPGIDTVWDLIHTFIKIPAGALIAAGLIGAGDGPAWALAAGLLGGSITAGSHFLKTGSRAAINTSPEPVSNWLASFTEDALVLSGLWLAFQHPLVFLLLLALFMLLVIWLIPKIWRLLTRVAKRLIPHGGPAT